MAKIDTMIAGRHLSLNSTADAADMRRVADAAAARIEAVRLEQGGLDALTLTTLALLNLISEDEKLNEQLEHLRLREDDLRRQQQALQARVDFLEEICQYLEAIQKETREQRRRSPVRTRTENPSSGSEKPADKLLLRQQSFL